jgi:hypothetical protein
VADRHGGAPPPRTFNGSEALDMIDQTLLGEVSERSLLRGVVLRVESEHQVVVRVRHGEDYWVMIADRVVTSETPVLIGRGDRVLCWADPDDRERGVMLGRIGPPATPAPAAPASTVPDTLVLEAKQTLTLRVGEGSITIREDGKILIKGRDLVSHAQRTNRIRGGAVAIN